VISFFAIAVMPDVLEAFAPLTGGSSGLVGISPMQVGNAILPGWAVYEVILVTAVVTWLATRSLVTSGWGIVLRGARDHPVATASSGVNLQLTRAWVYVLLAIPCGLAGVEFAHSQLYLTPSNFTFNMILLLIGGVFLGGRGTLWGPLIGIAIFEGITFWIGPFSGLNQLLLGAGVLVAALGFRGGVVATARRWLGRLRRRRPNPDGVVRLEAVETISLPRLERAAGLRVQGVTKSFGVNRVLRSVDLEVRAGRVLALIGPNGSGKTTLLNVVSGFVRKDAGRITLNGHDVAGASPHRTARMGLGRTFQVPRLVDELTVAQNVELGILGADRQRVLGSLLGTPWERARARHRRGRARDVCRFLGFPDEFVDTRASSLPLGLKRIVEIGRAIASDAPVVCLDEPAAGLNDAERLRLAAVLRGLAAAGRAVLLIEHNTRFVLDACDDVVLLENGAVVARGHSGAEPVMEPKLRDYVKAYTV
jgi:branched-chain amino acid transport system permease protein